MNSLTGQILFKDFIYFRRTHIWRNNSKYLSIYFLRIAHVYDLLKLNMACKNNIGSTKRIFNFLKTSSNYFKSYIYHINNLWLLLSLICICLYYKNRAYQNYHEVNMTKPNALFPSALAQHHNVFPLCYIQKTQHHNVFPLCYIQKTYVKIKHA